MAGITNRSQCKTHCIDIILLLLIGLAVYAHCLGLSPHHDLYMSKLDLTLFQLTDSQAFLLSVVEPVKTVLFPPVLQHAALRDIYFSTESGNASIQKGIAWIVCHMH